MRRSVLASLFVSLVSLILVAASPARAESPPPDRSAGDAMWPGLALFAASYGYSAALGGSAYRTHARSGEQLPEMFIPVVGPWLALRKDRLDADSMIAPRLGHALQFDQCGSKAVICPASLFITLPLFLVEGAVLLVDPVAQATGLVLAVVGDGKRPKAARSDAGSRISLAPTWPGGPGLSLTVISR
jgi:hypothetical protein